MKDRRFLWRGLASTGAFALTVLTFGTSLAVSYTGAINNALGIATSRYVDDGGNEDTEYWKSEFGEKTEENQAKLIEAGFAQNINEEKEGAVLLSNISNALPLSGQERKVTLLGHASYDPAYKSSSAGSRPNFKTPYAIDLKTALENAGFSVNEEMYNAYANSSTSRGQVMDFGMSFPVRVMDGSGDYEEPASFYTDDLKASFQNYNDVAVIVFAREASEGNDMLTQDKDGRSSLALHQNEEDLLNMAKAAGFGKIIVLLNSAYPMEVDALADYGVDAVLMIGEPGSQGFTGVVSILTGETNPSGHLVDTFATNSLSAPAVVNGVTQTPQFLNADAINTAIGEDENADYMNFQAEGIYIGYKYYETRYEDAVLGQGNADGTAGV